MNRGRKREGARARESAHARVKARELVGVCERERPKDSARTHVEECCLPLTEVIILKNIWNPIC